MEDTQNHHSLLEDLVDAPVALSLEEHLTYRGIIKLGNATPSLGEDTKRLGYLEDRVAEPTSGR